ncbi:LysM peptidoglycan-binding domain-containing protein [Georgenia faecalis]|uniref:LysM peptidoglycan-binding domain-containing protein n=1 Tax=Georgenia faecalis TaxID=2483799 RepID=A0ABV9DC60_9MICO|nr:LysM peptidoglycan-binding domain-containing protein [Georgenia faecalis]
MSAVTALPTVLPVRRSAPRPRLELVGPGFVPVPRPAPVRLAPGHPAPARPGVARPAVARPPVAHPAVAVAAAPPSRAVAPTGHLRLTARGRAVLAVGAFVLATMAAVLVGAWAGQLGADAAVVATERVTVGSGDTLWEIASVVAAPGQDVRDLVDQLVALNGLPSGDLRAGQQILVPAR